MLNKSILLFCVLSFYVVVNVIANDSFTKRLQAEFEYSLYDSILPKAFLLQNTSDSLLYIQTLYAVNDITSVVQMASRNDVAMNNLIIAKAYASLSNADSACFYLRRALENDVNVSRSEILLDTSLVKISNSSCWKELWKTQWYTNDQMELSRLFYELENHNYSEVLDFLFAKEKDFHQKQFLMALAYNGLGQDNDALDVLSEVEDLDEVLLKTDIQMKVGKYSRALKNLESISENSTEVNKRKAMCLFALKEYHKSEMILRKYLETYYMDSEMLTLQASNCKEIGDYLTALKLLNQSLLFDSANSEALKLRGDIFFKLREWNLAVKSYQKCLDFKRKDVDVIENLALSLLELGREEEACKELQYAKLYGSDKAVELLLYHCRK